jgi:PAS domain S-box-containing protein
MDELLNTAPCGFLSFEDDGRVRLVNETLLQMLGRERGEVVGRHVESLLPVASRIFYQTHLFPILKLHGRVDEVYFTLRSKSGAEIPVLVNAARRERGGVTLNECVLMHMRQRDQYEGEILRAKREAEDATRAKDEFLAMVSHELRTPLTAILGWAEMMSSGRLDADSVARGMETIKRNARSQLQLIEDLLDISRIISGKIRLDVRAFDPASVVEAAVDVVRPAADAKGIRLRPVLDPKAGPVSADPERLQQVLWNLLSNAVKFTPKGGRVEVRLERVDSSVEISVSDTGQGISAEFLPYVFDRFRQAEGAKTTRQGGLGLGMAITKHLVELHGGTIRAESPGEGQGSTFTLRLPAKSIHAGEPRASSVERGTSADEVRAGVTLPARLEGVRVLVVDDESDARELLIEVLSRSGAQVRAVASADAAIDELRSAPPDVLVSDIDMPGEDGFELIRRARESEEGRAVPAIALTGHARASDRIRILSAGYQLHVPKPVEPTELVLAVAGLLGRLRGV